MTSYNFVPYWQQKITNKEEIEYLIKMIDSQCINIFKRNLIINNSCVNKAATIIYNNTLGALGNGLSYLMRITTDCDVGQFDRKLWKQDSLYRVLLQFKHVLTMHNRFQKRQQGMINNVLKYGKIK